MKKTASIFLALLLTACTTPETTVRTGSPRASISVQGAGDGAQLLVDGLVMGDAARFNGNPQVLIIEEGAHVIEIRSLNRSLFREKIYVGSGEHRSISVSAGAQ